MSSARNLLLSIGYISLITITVPKVYTCNDNSCQNKAIECEESACEIQCTESLSCSGLEVNCPPRGACTISCKVQDSCQGITVHAETSTELQVKVGSDRNVISEAHIYVPNSHMHSKTIIDCGAGTVACNQMNIYSTYGIADVTFNCRSENCFSKSYLHCHEKAGNAEGYSQSCPLRCNSDNTVCTCEDKEHICNNLKTPNPTNAPTQMTVSPTTYPSNIPTVYPTVYPTSNPTNMPTVSPVREGEVKHEEIGSHSNGKNDGNDAMNGQMNIMDSNVFYAGLIIVGTVLCFVVIGVIFWRHRTKRSQLKLEMEDRATKVQRISSMSQTSHLSDNEVMNGMHMIPMTPNGVHTTTSTAALSMTPQGMDVDTPVTEGEGNDAENEDMYVNDEEIYDGNRGVTATGDVTPQYVIQSENDDFLLNENDDETCEQNKEPSLDI